MSVVLNERFLDQQIQVITGETQLATITDLLRKGPGNTLGNIGDKVTVFVVEDLILFLLA